MEKTTRHIDSLFAEAGEYFETKTELLKLKVADSASDIISFTTTGIALAGIFVIFFIIINIGVALWLGDVTGKNYYGFFIVGGFYALVALIIYIFRETWIKTPVSNMIVKKIFK